MQRSSVYIASAILLTSLAHGQATSDEVVPKPPTDVRSTLHEVEALASGATFEADALAGDPCFFDLSRITHADFLTTMEDSLLDAEEQLQILEFEQASLTPWERVAIAKVEPLLKDAESKIELAMHYVETNQDPSTFKTYRGYARTIFQDCTKAADLLEIYLKAN
jgi:hypothetical protein